MRKIVYWTKRALALLVAVAYVGFFLLVPEHQMEESTQVVLVVAAGGIVLLSILILVPRYRASLGKSTFFAMLALLALSFASQYFYPERWGDLIAMAVFLLVLLPAASIGIKWIFFNEIEPPPMEQ